MENKWKTTAIVFIVLFSLLLLYNIWAVSLYYTGVEKSNICYYDICEYYPDAHYSENVCYCLDSYGNTKETKYMGS